MALQDPMKWLRRQTAPVTVILCALVVFGALVTWSLPLFVLNQMAYLGSPIPKVWTLVTYPFIGGMSPIFLLLQVMWLFWVGSMLERDHGKNNFIILWISVSVLGALAMTFTGAPVMGMLIPDATLVAIWATRYPNMIIRLFMCIPVPAKWLGLVVVASVFFSYASGPGQILTGLAAITGCILGWFYAKNMIPKVPYGLRSMVAVPKPTRAERAKDQAYYDDVHRREKEREEKDRLRKLFEDSSEDKP
jgi:membrane associated rhomboid family serine protease